MLILAVMPIRNVLEALLPVRPRAAWEFRSRCGRALGQAARRSVLESGNPALADLRVLPHASAGNPNRPDEPALYDKGKPSAVGYHAGEAEHAKVISARGEGVLKHLGGTRSVWGAPARSSLRPGFA